MDWTVIGVGVSIILLLGSLMLYLHSSLKKDTEDIHKRLDRIEERLGYMEKDHGERLARIERAFQEAWLLGAQKDWNRRKEMKRKKEHEIHNNHYNSQGK